MVMGYCDNKTKDFIEDFRAANTLPLSTYHALTITPI